MKLKAIKDPKKLIGGQFYIRAWLDYYGKIMLTIYKINGNIFTSYLFGSNDKIKQLKIRTVDTLGINENYITDMGIGDNTVFKILVPFSNKTFEYLTTISIWELAFIQNDNHLNQGEYDKMIKRWKDLKDLYKLQSETMKIYVGCLFKESFLF